MGRNRSLHVLAFLALSGCSLGIAAPDPARPPSQVPRCDTGKTAVALDGILATGLTLGAVAAFDQDENSSGLALLAVGGLFLASAFRGNSAANACHAAFESYTGTLEARRRAPIVDEPQPPIAQPQPPIAQPPIVQPQPPITQPPPPIAQPQPPIAQPQPAPAVEAPPPVVASPAPTRTPAPPPKRAPTSEADDDWSAFWKELP